MHRFFLPPEAFQADTVRFPAETAHQIRRVLRLGAGAEVLALDNQGWQYRVQLAGDDLGHVIRREAAAGEPALHLTLFLALTQREKFEWALQKCTEAGVSAFVPFVSTRSLVQDAQDAHKKLPRWQKIVQEAAEQSGRGRIPPVAAPLPWAGALQSAQAASLRWIAWEEEQQTGLRTALRGLSPVPGQTAAVFIGPEGGFTPAEVEQAHQSGCQPLSLGPRILRMETAALAAAVLLVYELG